MGGNSEDRYLPSGIVNPIYNAIRIQANTQLVVPFRQLLGLLGPRLVYQAGDRPEHSLAIGFRLDCQKFPDDGGLANYLIACHAFAVHKQMNQMS